jgi:deoxycytidine triphosphate deaminase
MATILSDHEIRKLLGKVIVGGDESCIRPNSYVLRMGDSGEFLNSGKEFSLGKKKKGIKIQPGHSVALTALETLDFRREVVHQIYPDYDLHGIVSPTTDLSREGIVAPTTQVDAGYTGTLNWTITNTSSEERRFLFKERIFRLTIFRLEEGETPEQIYAGDYQEKTGYVRSQRKGAPVGMKDVEWEDSVQENGPEALLDNLLKSGYPWHALGLRLKALDEQFKTVTNEYADIRDHLDRIGKEVDGIRRQNTEIANDIPKTVRRTIQEEATNLQNRWLLGSGAIVFGLAGFVLTVLGSQAAIAFLKQHGPWVGLVLILAAVIGMVIVMRTGKDREPRDS